MTNRMKSTSDCLENCIYDKDYKSIKYFFEKKCVIIFIIRSHCIE